MAEKGKSEADKEYQVRLVTKLPDVSVSDAAMTVPGSLDCAGLDNIVRGLLEAGEEEGPQFDWLCLGEILRGSLEDHVLKRNDITAETVIELEYIERKLPPEPQVEILVIISSFSEMRLYSDEILPCPVQCQLTMFRCRPITTTG